MQPQKKERVVSSEGNRKFYSAIARNYKWLHTLQTLGADWKHRRCVVDEAALTKKDIVLDVGTGTALTAIMAAKKAGHVIGVDPCQQMLNVAEDEIVRADALNVELVNANAEKMPLESSIFTAIISTYGLGGFADIKKAMDEIVRTAQDGARVVFAEMVCPPDSMPIRKWMHQKIVEPIIMKIWHFRDIDLPKLMQEAGIVVEKTQYFTDRVFGSTLLVKGTVVKKAEAN